MIMYSTVDYISVYKDSTMFGTASRPWAANISWKNGDMRLGWKQRFRSRISLIRAIRAAPFLDGEKVEIRRNKSLDKS